jgi:hypothetical protein
MELVTGAGKALEPQTFEAAMRLHVHKAYLDPLSLRMRTALEKVEARTKGWLSRSSKGMPAPSMTVFAELDASLGTRKEHFCMDDLLAQTGRT